MAHRSENTYQKINTIFLRDDKNCIMKFSGFVSPELEWLRNCKFRGEEKIDGTNIRIEVRQLPVNIENGTAYLNWDVSYKGKTDNAQIPPKLESFLKTTYPEDKVLAALGLEQNAVIATFDASGTSIASEFSINHKWVAFDKKGNATNILCVDRIPNLYTLYGEGYGSGIQSGGYYRKDNAFIGFDVKVNDLYLSTEQRDEIFNNLNCPIVPYIGDFTIDEAIDYVQKGFNSKISEEEHFAEGLVLRSPVGVCNRKGERIIFKVKHEDFVKYRNVYGTDGPVEQVIHKNA